ncbi:MAG: hypothetical protein GY801_24810, partial [bacterium]|nr:hypothetical protein [bacterium]
LTDAAGAELRRLAYRAFGEEAENVGSGSAPKYSYTGKELDSSGLMYYGARCYDPALSRFITADTIYDLGPQGLNLYSYALNNPIRYNDPSGHFINGPDDDRNLTCDGCVTGPGNDGVENMTYHEDFDDPSHLDVGHAPRWPRIASMSDDVIIPAPHRVDELWAEPGTSAEQTVKKVGRKIAQRTGDYAGTLLGRDDNVFTGEPIAASTKHAVIMDVITTAAFYGISKIGPAGGVIKASKSSTALTGPFKGPYTKGVPADTLDGISTRKWYRQQLDAIPGQIDRTLSLRNQARQAFELRNKARIDGRALMSNRAKALEWDVTDPIRTWQGQIKFAVEERGKSGSEIWEYIWKVQHDLVQVLMQQQG